MFHPTSDRIGIIGAGTITAQFYIPALRNMGYTDIVLHDIHEQSVQSLAAQYNLQTTSLPDLISLSDVLIIATPPHTHYNLLEQCVVAGNKTVICEKPFLYSKQEAETIAALAQQYGSRVRVAHLRRTFTAIQVAKQLIPTLQPGTLLKAAIWEGSRFTYKPKSDYTTANRYGGVLLDTGSHALDCFLYVTGLSGMPLSCAVQHVQKDKPEPAHEVSYTFTLDSVQVNLQLSRYAALANKMVLYYKYAIVEIPLGLKPNIAITQNGKRSIVSSEQACISYMSEAFRTELGTMLRGEAQLFDVSDFIALTSVLETLYNA